MLIDSLPCHYSQFQKNYKMGKVLATSLCFVLLAQQPGQKQWWLQWKQANTFIGTKALRLSLLLKWKLVSTTRKEKGPWAPYPLSTQEKTVTPVALISSGHVAPIDPRYDQTDLHREIKDPVKAAHWRLTSYTRKKMGNWSKKRQGADFQNCFMWTACLVVPKDLPLRGLGKLGDTQKCISQRV